MPWLFSLMQNNFWASRVGQRPHKSPPSHRNPEEIPKRPNAEIQEVPPVDTNAPTQVDKKHLFVCFLSTFAHLPSTKFSAVVNRRATTSIIGHQFKSLKRFDYIKLFDNSTGLPLQAKALISYMQYPTTKHSP